VEAFDIESDGSVGSLAVPGQLGGRLETPCAPIQTSPCKIHNSTTLINCRDYSGNFIIKPKATEPLSTTLIVVIVVIIVVVVAVIIIILLVPGVMLVCKSKR
jgi:hypothetical protein